MAKNDPEAYHAFAEKLLAEEYSYEAVENFRLNGSDNEEVISGIYDRVVAQPDGVKAELSAIVAKYNFMQTLTVAAKNDKDTYHQSLKNFLASQQENPAEFQYDYDQFELARQNLALGDKRTFEELVPDLLAMVSKTDSNALNDFNNDLAVNYVARENKQNSFNAEMRSLAADDAAFTDYAKTIMGEDFPDASINEVKENLLSGNTETSFKASSEILDKVNQLDSVQQGKLSKIMTGYNFLLMLQDLKDHDIKAYDKFVDKLSIDPNDDLSYGYVKTIYQSLNELPSSVRDDAYLIFNSSLQERNLKAGLADALTNFADNKEGLQHFIGILQADRGFDMPEGVTLESIMSIMGGEDKDAKASLVDKVFPAIKGVSLETIQAANDFTIDTKKREKSREMLVLSLVQMQETDEKTLDTIIAEISDEPAKVKQLLQDISNTQGEEKAKLVSSFADILAPLWEEAFTSIVEKVNASSQWVTFKEGLILQASDKDTFHANAKIFTGDGAYNPEQVEGFRNQLLAVDANDEKAIDALLRPVYEERLTNSPESIGHSLENMQEYHRESLFQDSYFPMAGNKKFFHQATKQLLDDPRSEGVYNEAEVEAFRLDVVKAFGVDDRAALDQLMQGKYEIVKNVNQSTSNAFIQTHKEFLIDNQTRGAYKSLVEKLAVSEDDFHSYVKASMGAAYSDEMKSTVEEWRIAIRDKKEGYEELISAGYDSKMKPENVTSTAESDRILDAFELKDTLVELSKNDEYFLEYVGKYLQASSPGSSHSPAEIKTIAEDIKAKIKTEGHAALTGVYDAVASFEKDTKEALLGVINKDRAETNFKTDFSELAKTPEKFNTLMQTSFGESYNKENAESIRVKAAAGYFSWMPKVEVLKQDVFAKASLSNGEQASSTLVAAAFDGESILLNEAILSDSVLMNQAFTEEMGHSLDKIVNGAGSDAKGEEGEIFRRLLSGEELGAEQLSSLRAEDDSGVLAGKNVEFFS